MYFVIRVNRVSGNGKSAHSFCSKSCKAFVDNGKLTCDCGNDVNIFDWVWQRDDNSGNFLLEPENLEVTFHPVYSSGTALVRGNKILKPNMHYYWEIKIISNLYGTDVMVGVGTDKITNCKFKFCSMLGLDDQSWGYSYHGNIQHDKLTRKYGISFGLGCIIGVHLDMCRGKLEYYLNRKPLGVAFDGLKNKEIYPMVCSTAAKSAIRLNCAVSQQETLQMLCLKCVQQNTYLNEIYRTIPGLHRYYDQKYFWMSPPEETPSTSKEEEDDKLHLLTINNKKKKRLSEFIWSKPMKKMSKVRRSTDEQNAEPSCSRETEEGDKDVCQLVYEHLNDSESDLSRDSLLSEISDDENVFVNV